MSQPGNSPQLSVSESLPEKVNFTDLCARGLKQIIVCCTPHFKKVQSCIINWKRIMFCMSLLLRLLELHGCLLGFIHSMIVRPLCLLMRFTRRGTREGNCSLHTTPSVKCYLGWLHTTGTTMPGTCQSTGAKWCCCHRPTPTPMRYLWTDSLQSSAAHSHKFLLITQLSKRWTGIRRQMVVLLVSVLTEEPFRAGT